MPAAPSPTRSSLDMECEKALAVSSTDPRIHTKLDHTCEAGGRKMNGPLMSGCVCVWVCVCARACACL
jgi:hypothetical protein